MLCYALALNYYFFILNYYFSLRLHKALTNQNLIVGKPRRADPTERGEVCKPGRRDRERESQNSPT